MRAHTHNSVCDLDRAAENILLTDHCTESKQDEIKDLGVVTTHDRRTSLQVTYLLF
jgi:hypothetical protein